MLGVAIRIPAREADLPSFSFLLVCPRARTTYHPLAKEIKGRREDEEAERKEREGEVEGEI